MEIIPTGKRGFTIRFDDVEDWITNIYLCFAENRTYLIDTFCGPDMMTEIREFIRKQAPGKPLVVINTHFHWDHIWGNSAFPENAVIAHERCRENMEKHWESQLKENANYQMGRILKHLPTQVFTSSLAFPEDEVELRHTPGHTDDCISFFDHGDKIIFAGDNIEHPVPYVESADLDRYLKTLKEYLGFTAYRLVSSHADVTGDDLIRRNIQYLERLQKGEDQLFTDHYTNRVHLMNLQFLHHAAQGRP